MERLVDNDLIYGGLVEVNQPHMIKRYNQALKAFGLKPTKRKSFLIDATGYSPEIAADLKDEQYLDPNGVNRRFIILTPAQAEQPVVYANFSSTSDLMSRFFKENAESIKTLTLKDVIYGEIEDSTYQVDDIDDIMSIKQVRFTLHTHNRLIEKSDRLTKLTQEFQTREHAWNDDAMIKEILALARECGDTRYNNLVPRHVSFEQLSFWTRHFGGIYVFHDEGDKAIVSGWTETPPFENNNGAQIKYIPLSQQDVILKYLTSTDRIEPLNLDWIEHSDILKSRYDIYTCLAYARDNPEASLKDLDDLALQNWVFKNSAKLKKDETFSFLTRMNKAVLNGHNIDVSELPAGLLLMAVRANPKHRDAQMVNQFLSEYVPFDFLTRFIVNKIAFYVDYEGFSAPLRDYAVDLILQRYFVDKQVLRERLFEHIPQKSSRKTKPKKQTSERKGPWGMRPKANQ